MLELLAILAIIVIYASAYIVSLYSLAVYIDPEEVESLFPNVARRQRNLLKKLVADPRAFVQLATVYKSFALILVVSLAVFVLRSVSAWVGVGNGYVIAFGLALVWLLQVFCVEYLARRASRHAIKNIMPKYLWLVNLLYITFYPVVHGYRRALRRSRAAEHVTEDEKEDIVERAIETLADQAGIGEAIVEEDEKEMIGQIFALDQTIVREIMVPRIDITAIDRSMSFKDIQDMVLSDGHSRYPVYEESVDKVIGMLYVKDLFNNMPQPGEEFVITNYLRKPYFVPESKVIATLLRDFQSRKLHLAIVVDEYGGVAGLVTLEDIIEEVFGEFQDEHDSEEAELIEVSGDEFMVDAGMLMEKLQDHLHTDYDQEDYDTVGGLIYDLVGSVPAQGTKVKWFGLNFEVLEVDGQRIKHVRVTRRIHREND